MRMGKRRVGRRSKLETSRFVLRCFLTPHGNRWKPVARRSKPDSGTHLAKCELLNALAMASVRMFAANLPHGTDDDTRCSLTEYPHEIQDLHISKNRQRPVLVWRTPALQYSVPARCGRSSICHVANWRDFRYRSQEFSPDEGRRAAS